LLWRALKDSDPDPIAPVVPSSVPTASKTANKEAKGRLSERKTSIADSEWSSLYNTILFRDVIDIVLGTPVAEAPDSNAAISRQSNAPQTESLSQGCVLSIVTPTHSLEIEMDTGETPEISAWIGFNPSSRSRSAGASTSSTSRASSMFGRLSASTANEVMNTKQKMTPEELAMCPKTPRRHPFVRALRTIVFLRPYIALFKYILTRPSNKEVESVLLSNKAGSKKPGKPLRPIDRAKVSNLSVYVV
jgi:hypothetical protein